MSTSLLFENLMVYSLQIGWLVGIAACVPVILRLRQPGAKLIYWQILLTVCLLLPLQPWRQAILTGVVQVTTIITAVAPASHASSWRMPPRSEIALLLMLAGVAIRLGWLAVGFWKLHWYRRHANPLTPAPSWGVEASLLISEDVASPVTFGWRKPVVLLPASFPTLEPRVQEAILCHEIMHVRRGDWLFTLAEELVRAVFWFHPAIWWLLGEIGLAREQEVDRLAIEITNEREEYMDALLAIAGAPAGLDLAPAPLFLRKRHLKHRVVLIVKEARMSKARLISTLVTGLGILAAACWLVTGAIPLTAQPVVVYDAPGVTVNLNGAAMLHRTGVDYPVIPRKQGVQGTVSVEVRLDSTGSVADARVLSGPEELRKTVLQSVLAWHFGHDLAGTTRSVQVTFQPPKEDAASEVVRGRPGVTEGVLGGIVGGVPGGAIGGIAGGVFLPAPPPPPLPNQMQAYSAGRATSTGLPTRISAIRFTRLSDEVRNELLAKLPVREGDELTSDMMQRVTDIVRAYDEHFIVGKLYTSDANGPALNLAISAPGGGSIAGVIPAGVQPQFSSSDQRIRIGGNVASALIIRKVPPVYPPLALSARVSGVVHLAAIIGKEGHIQELHSLGGPALLIQSAMDAVRQWVYQPSLANGEAVAVETTIDVNFTINE